MPLTISAAIAAGVHLFPFRTEKLSPPAPMVLGGQPPGRVGRRRLLLRGRPPGRPPLWSRTITRMEIRDDELVLRPIEARDADADAAGLADPETSRYMLQIPTPYTPEDARTWVARCEQVWRDETSYPFAIVDAAGGAFLGAIELSGDSGSIGYWVAPEAL